jgi:hypothetical protein
VMSGDSVLAWRLATLKNNKIKITDTLLIFLNFNNFYAKFGIIEELVAPQLLPIYRLSEISLRIRLSDLGATPR